MNSNKSGKCDLPLEVQLLIEKEKNKELKFLIEKSNKIIENLKIENKTLKKLNTRYEDLIKLRYPL